MRHLYRIREVDGQDEEISDTLTDLHRLTFFGSAPLPPFDWGHWWLAFHENMPVGFAGLVPSTHADNAGYFCRVGVTQNHCGNSLQLRFMRALELRARRNGWSTIVSDTTGNVASANNFIRAGYRLYSPREPWGWLQTLYWRKDISGAQCDERDGLRHMRIRDSGACLSASAAFRRLPPGGRWPPGVFAFLGYRYGMEVMPGMRCREARGPRTLVQPLK